LPFVTFTAFGASADGDTVIALISVIVFLVTIVAPDLRIDRARILGYGARRIAGSQCESWTTPVREQPQEQLTGDQVGLSRSLTRIK
jgi:hypothetical protein